MSASVSWLRVSLMVGAVLALLPLGLLFGLPGLLVGLVFLILAAMAK